MPADVAIAIGSVALAALLLLATMIFLMRRPARVSVEVVRATLRVEPLGLDKLWCLRRHVLVPVSAVTGSRVAMRENLILPNLRLPGSYIPGIIAAGSYGVGRHRAFWNVRRGQRLLVIDCAPGNRSGYHQLVLEMPNPDASASALQQALSASRQG
jgi:hypothetical protein